MIHQLIFAHPKPGLSEADFQSYWRDVHAKYYASRIPQIRKYMLDFRIPFGPEPEDPPWSGVAEIWIANDEDQLASIQTPEFLQGARHDEPNWAAFWRTVALDTDPHEIVLGPGEQAEPTWIKLMMLVKRAEGVALADFRERSLGKYADLVREVPGLRRYLQGHTRDGAYGVGEAILDGGFQMWFDDTDALAAALESPEWARADEELRSFVAENHLHTMVVDERWVIGPEPR